MLGGLWRRTRIATTAQKPTTSINSNNKNNSRRSPFFISDIGIYTSHSSTSLRLLQRVIGIRMRCSNSNGSGGGGDRHIYFGPFEVTSQVFLTTPHSFALVNLKPLLPGHVLVCPSRPHRRLTDLAPAEMADLWTTVQRVQRMLARRYFPPSFPLSSSRSTIPSITAAAAAVGAPEDGSFNLAVQDGAGAGQTVPHVHVHVIPRVPPSGPRPDGGDEIYEQMAAEDGNVGGALWDAAAAAAAAENREGKQEGEDDDDLSWRRKHEQQRRRPRPGGAFPRIEDCQRRPRSMAEMEAEAAEFRALLREMEAE